MDFFLKKIKIPNLYVDWQLEGLHSTYKTCLANQVKNYMETGKMEDNELCTKEKANFYNSLHEKRKIEHDSLLRFYSLKVDKN